MQSTRFEDANNIALTFPVESNDDDDMRYVHPLHSNISPKHN